LLVNALKIGSLGARRRAISALQKHGWHDSSTVPMLTAYLQDGDALGQSDACQILGNIGANAAPAAPLLLKDEYSGRTALVKIGEPAVPALLNAASGTDRDKRLGPAAAPAVPALIDAIRNHSAQSDSAVVALGKIGPAAKDAVPTLLRADAGDFGYIDHAQAHAALLQIDPDAVHRAKIKAWAIPTAAIAGYALVLGLLWIMWRRLSRSSAA